MSRAAVLAAGASVLWLLPAPGLAQGLELPNDGSTLLLLRFDGTLQGASGETPVGFAGVSFTPGVVGAAAHVASAGFIRYAKADNLQSLEGTVEFWIRPDWAGAQPTPGHLFFMAGGFFNDGMLLAIDGAHNLRFIQWGDDPSTPGVEVGYEAGVAASGAGWIAGEWHHLAATWTAQTREMTFYVDGQQVGAIVTGPRIPAFSGDDIVVGASTAGTESAEASFDEYRISDRARSAGEILADYQAGLGRSLAGPFGLDVDSTGRTVVAELGDRVTVFNRDGTVAFRFGMTGARDGELRGPTDVAVDGSDGIWVADPGNDRVQRFDPAGVHTLTIGSAGTEPGQFREPRGIHVDRARGRVYVADTGNHRVQRFLPDGTLDPSWGAGGVVGTTGVVRRDHSGFDRPTNVAVHPLDGTVYVADFGNQRLEVYDQSGRYVRTFLAVYRPHSLAFDPTGDLYVAGEDPNDSYTAFDGRLRRLRRGDELLGAHYTGGLDDIGRIEGGVALSPDGAVIFSDALNGRLVRTDAAFRTPIRDLVVRGHGTSLTFRWTTAHAAPSRVRYGPRRALEKEAVEATPVTDHEVRVQGLTPNTRLYYAVSFPDSFDGTLRLTPTDVLNTGAPAGHTQFLRLKAVGLIYRDARPGVGFAPMTAEELAAARRRYQTISRFYWLNSGFRLWLDYTIVESDRDLVDDGCLGGLLEPDLAAAGFGPADSIDAVHATSVLSCGNFGGAGILFGRNVGQSEWVTQNDFEAIHEVNHSLDSIYLLNELGKYEFNHGIWAIPNSVGRDYTVNGQIPRNMLPLNFTATRAPFDKVMTAPDADEDGVPDSSPPGLTQPLSVTEATLGSSTSSPDSDGDGQSDLQEATALTFHGSDPRRRDTDGDGVADGSDRNPAYPIHDRIARGSPSIDGTIDAGEGWTMVSDRWGYSNDALVPDSNALQARVTTYAAWDDDFFYLALKGPPSLTTVHLDGSADNWFRSPDNYRFSVRNDADFVSVAVNVGVPDVFRQIDDDGQFSEFLDTDPKFSRPYQGRPIFSAPGDGLGFPGRLVTEADLRYQRGGTGDEAVWELAVPWSDMTLFRGSEGKDLAIEIEVDGDRLFETDNAARHVLVEKAGGPVAITVAVDFLPRSCPNRLNLDDKGEVSVAVLGMRGFKVRDVDPASIRLEGIAPLRFKLKDVARPLPLSKPRLDCDDCTSKGPDGRLDLRLKFDRRQLAQTLGDAKDGECRIVTLTGSLKADRGGTPIEGVDVVTIRRDTRGPAIDDSK